MRRLYEQVIKNHLGQYGQMAFLAGPRQVGKTTISLASCPANLRHTYLNWDNQDHRKLLLSGPNAVAEFVGLPKLQATVPTVIFDEIHKYAHWQTFLKGFFDTYKHQLRIIVTGSSKLDVYRRGGDSLMGRYFPYRVHPFSVAECLRTMPGEQEIQPPQPLDDTTFEHLFNFGGFPEPFLASQTRFSQRWQRLREEQLLRGDIRDLSHIQEIERLEILAQLLKEQAGQLINYSNLANKINVSVDTIKRWLNTLNSFYYCFTLKPWSHNITRSLLKEPKVYLWDWAQVNDIGQRTENFIASHLLKAVHFWTDQGLGNYALYFLRDKEKREVDFLVTKNNQPWFLVEAKHSDNSRLSPALALFQRQTQAQHAFQVVLNSAYVAADCFSQRQPVIVPAKTFLAQLV